MKKVIFTLMVAGSLIACNNTNTAETTIDSLDSVAIDKKEMLDSTADAKIEVVDSTYDAMKDSIIRVDTVKKSK